MLDIEHGSARFEGGGLWLNQFCVGTSGSYSDTASGTLTMVGSSPVITVAAGTTTLNCSMAGTGVLTKAGAGTLVLNNANSFSGTLTVSAGTVTLSHADALGSVTLVEVFAGAQLSLMNSTAFNTSAPLNIHPGGSLYLANGLTLTVNDLYFDGVLQASGSWGAPGSGADHTDSRFQGPGKLQNQARCTLTVNNGTGSGYYSVGSSVPITATVPVGSLFDSWQIDSGSPTIDNVNAKNTNLKILAGDVTVTSLCHATDLVGYWKCNETTGITVSDSSGFHNDGAVYGGTPVWTTGMVDGALKFDGTSYMQVANSPELAALGDNNADFSVAFWMRLDQAATGSWRCLMRKGGADNWTFAMVMPDSGNNLVPVVTTSGGVCSSAVSSRQLVVGAWTHVACVKSGSQLKLYINGTLDTTLALPGVTAGNSGPLYVGNDPWSPGVASTLDDLRLYNRGLSATEVQRMSNVDKGAGKMVLRWKCDEGTGTAAADATGYHNDGVVVGASSWTSGINGSAFKFDGTSYLQAANSPQLQAVGEVNADFSVSFWMRLDKGATGSWRCLMRKGGAADWTFAMVMPDSGNNLVPVVTTSDGVCSSAVSSRQLVVGAWTHVACVKSGSQLKLYINGTLDTTLALPGATAGNSGPFYVGNDPWSPGVASTLDELRIYNCGLTAAEVTTLANSNMSSALLHWKLDDGSGTVALDDSGNRNAATMVGSPVWTTGKAGGALKFNGVNYLQAASSPTLDGLGAANADFSVAFWMRLDQAATGSWRCLMHKGSSTSEWTFSMVMPNSGNNLVPVVTTSGGVCNSAVSSRQLVVGAWTHVACVKSGSQLKLYINGTLDTTLALPGATVGNSGPLYVGNDPWNAGVSSALDEVRFYDRAVSATEISQMISSPTQ